MSGATRSSPRQRPSTRASMRSLVTARLLRCSRTPLGAFATGRPFRASFPRSREPARPKRPFRASGVSLDAVLFVRLRPGTPGRNSRQLPPVGLSASVIAVAVSVCRQTCIRLPISYLAWIRNGSAPPFVVRAIRSLPPVRSIASATARHSVSNPVGPLGSCVSCCTGPLAIEARVTSTTACCASGIAASVRALPRLGCSFGTRCR